MRKPSSAAKFAAVAAFFCLFFVSQALAIVDGYIGQFRLVQCPIVDGKFRCSGQLHALATSSSSSSSSSSSASASSSAASSASSSSASSSSSSGGYNIAGKSIGSGCTCDLTVHDLCEGTQIVQTRYTSTISYTTSAPVYCGKFFNKTDYWIAPKTPGGTVTITEATPAATGGRNGLDLNPSGNTAALDSRLSGKPFTTLPLAINTAATPITSLVKADSRDNPGDCRENVNGKLRLCFDHLDTLTVLSWVPDDAGKTILRPPYYGPPGSKTLRSVSTVVLSRLPSIPRQSRPSGPINIDVTIDAALTFMSGIKGDWMTNFPNTEVFKAWANFGNVESGYSPNAWGPLWRHLQFIWMDPISFSINQQKKELLAVMLIEHGLDILAITKYHPDKVWIPNGAHGIGRYMMAMIAISLLSDSATLLAEFNTAIGDTAGEHNFAETGQIQAGTQGYPVYGARTLSDGNTYDSCVAQSNAIQAETAGKVDTGDYNSYPAAGEDCIYGWVPEYMDVTWGVMASEYIACAMIPECKAIADTEFMAYVDRVIQVGRKDYVGNNPANAVENRAALERCSGGSNNGLIGAANSDCPGGSRPAADGNFIMPSQLSVFALYTYEQLRTCVLASNCPGM